MHCQQSLYTLGRTVLESAGGLLAWHLLTLLVQPVPPPPSAIALKHLGAKALSTKALSTKALSTKALSTKALSTKALSTKALRHLMDYTCFRHTSAAYRASVSSGASDSAAINCVHAAPGCFASSSCRPAVPCSIWLRSLSAALQTYSS